MAINKEDILNSISEMSVKDVCELVEMMEKKIRSIQYHDCFSQSKSK